MQLSAGTGHRLLKVGRTIADIAGSVRIQTAHLAKAIECRQRELSCARRPPQKAEGSHPPPTPVP